MLLAELGPGQRFVVRRIAFGGEIGKRLADLGFVSGMEGEVVRAAPFQGPMQIRLGDYDLIMRRHEAKLVEVEPLPQTATEQAASEARRPIDLRLASPVAVRPQGHRHPALPPGVRQKIAALSLISCVLRSNPCRIQTRSPLRWQVIPMPGKRAFSMR
jgi:Fe2+ transport system protein FeoA